jgi:hypothetical protein
LNKRFVATAKDTADYPKRGNSLPWEAKKMSSPDENKVNLKQKILHEVKVYWIFVAYLTMVFGAFTWYRRLILADVGIAYTEYGVALIQAFIFAKVIMIGDALHIGRGLEHKPLIFPTLLKTAIFTVFVGLFVLIENAIKGLIKGMGAVEGVMAFLGKGTHEVLGGGLVIFVSFIPFFALRELACALGGEGKVLALFFKNRANL